MAQGSGSDAALVVESRAPSAVRDRDRTFRHALFAADLGAALLVAPLVAAGLDAHGPGVAAFVLVALVPFVYTATGLYKRDELVLCKSTLDEAPAVFQAATLAAVLAFLLESALVRVPLGAQVLGGTLLTLTLATVACRIVAREIARRLTPPERCVVIGDQEAENGLRSKLEAEKNVKATVVGRIAVDESPAAAAGALGPLEKLPAIVAAHDVHRVIIAGESATGQHGLEAIQIAKALGMRVSLVPRMLEVVGSSIAFDHVAGLTLLGVRRFGLSPASLRVKRAFDLVGSVTCLVLLSPLMAGLALAVKLTSPGPVVFRQTRIGRDGEPFEMLKYRSMEDGADARKDELLEHNEADGLFKIADDPRITRVGGFMRRTSLDELPQLVNVLRGEMSLVGPRPLVVDEDRRIEGWYRRRLHLPPGITGHWQVLGSARVPLREMVSIDYLYAANWSLWADAKILLRTIPCVLGRRGQ
jgi:exopolysaccharide biosynthesis polyprenyl glycosylphosphotransferase